MQSNPPLREGDFSSAWTNWFTQVFKCLPWKQGFNVAATVDFPSVSGQSQQASAVTVTGVRQGDSVTVTPSIDTAGIIYSGVVTADDTVTVYAKNFTAGAINPPSTTFRIVVIQN